jgi:hypothetical protein
LLLTALSWMSQPWALEASPVRDSGLPPQFAHCSWFQRSPYACNGSWRRPAPVSGPVTIVPSSLLRG